MVMPRRGAMYPCAESGRQVYRKRTELGAHVYCTPACYTAARSREVTSYPKIGDRHAHRVIAEQKLGRPLRPGEIVHHEDENKCNPAPDNLAVLPSQAEHARRHFIGSKQSPEHVRKRVEARRRTLANR